MLSLFAGDPLVEPGVLHAAFDPLFALFVVVMVAALAAILAVLKPKSEEPDSRHEAPAAGASSRKDRGQRTDHR